MTIRPLIRPPLIVDEWWNGYLSRALAINGYFAKSYFVIEKLSPFIESYVEASQASLHKIEFADDGVHCKYGAYLLPQWAVHRPHGAVSVCRHCLAKSPYVRMYWRLHSALRCDVHDAELISKCPSCQCKWYVSDVGRGRCRCGFEIPDTDSSDAVCKVLPASLDGAHDGSSASENSDSKYCNPQVTLACQAVMHRVVCALEKVRVAVLGPKGTSVSTRTFEPSYCPNPNVSSFSTLWHSLNSIAHLSMALYAVCEIIHAEKNAPTVLSVLPLWDFAKELAALGATTQRVERKGWLAPGALTTGYVTLKIAAKRAGIAPSILQTLKDRGVVEAEKMLEVGDERFLYSPKQIEELSNFRGGEGYGSNLGSKETTVLRHSKLIALLSSSVGRPWIDPIGLSNLLVNLDSIASDLNVDRKALVRLSDSYIWSWKNVDLIQSLFQKLQSSEFRLFSDRKSRGFSRFYIGSDAIGWLRYEVHKRMGTHTFSSDQDTFLDADPKPLQASPRPPIRSTVNMQCTDRDRAPLTSPSPKQVALW
jgi:hypothetical protein